MNNKLKAALITTGIFTSIITLVASLIYYPIVVGYIVTIGVVTMLVSLVYNVVLTMIENPTPEGYQGTRIK